MYFLSLWLNFACTVIFFYLWVEAAFLFPESKQRRVVIASWEMSLPHCLQKKEHVFGRLRRFWKPANKTELNSVHILIYWLFLSHEDAEGFAADKGNRSTWNHEGYAERPR